MPVHNNARLIIDMRLHGETYGKSLTRFLNRYPQDENNEWEILRVFYNEDGVAVTTHKRPPEELRFVTIYNGPLALRHEREIISVSYNKDGIRTGYSWRDVDRAKLEEDSRLLRTEMDRINAFASQGVQDFIDGKIGAADVSKIIDTIYNDLVSLSIALGNTDGNDPKVNAEILSAAQRIFSEQALHGTFGANQEEGAAYAKDNYGMSPSDRFVYYNARFFHLNKQLQEIGKTATTGIANEKGLEFDAEDIHQVRATIHKLYCFNAAWQNNAINMGSAVMKDIRIEPPEDFIMFYTPRRYSDAAWENGTTQIISASDPSRPDGSNAMTNYMIVPKGWSLFKSLPFWLTQGTLTNEDGKSFVNWDVSKHLNFNSGEDLLSLMKKFFAEYVNNPLHGDLKIWSNGTKSTHDVRFCYFDDKTMFHGNEFTSAVAHNSFASNFEFHIWSDFNHKSSTELFKS
jgi:hypothetical protein